MAPNQPSDEAKHRVRILVVEYLDRLDNGCVLAAERYRHIY